MAKRKIIWSHRARIKLFDILEFYSKRNRNPTYSTKLYQRFSTELLKLSTHPQLGIKTDDDTIRGLIVDKYILFYETTPDSIIVHMVWDSRQDPETLKIK